MEFEAPGADIVGFEYAATSEADREAIDTAVSDLARPLTLFVLPSAAGCNVVEANVALLGDEDHEEHDHDEHAHDDHDDHEDHAEDEHEEHGDEDHAEHDHDAHDHDEHAHDDHEDEQASGEHTEFHAEYKLDCTDPQAIDKIEFVYFERFPNALELDVQLVTDAGANAFEVERTSPVLDLRGMF